MPRNGPSFETMVAAVFIGNVLALLSWFVIERWAMEKFRGVGSTILYYGPLYPRSPEQPRKGK